jgi:methylated-DNA-protein-cysteine methyltransferase-like protein
MTQRASSQPSRTTESAGEEQRPADRQAFNQLVYDIVRAIPNGRLMTYGSIAALIPAPASVDPLAYRRVRARWVGYALGACPDDVPWQRVVNAKGRISARPGHGPPVQKVLLEEEGVVFMRGDTIDLTKLAWSPSRTWLRERGLIVDEQDEPS